MLAYSTRTCLAGRESAALFVLAKGCTLPIPQHYVDMSKDEVGREIVEEGMLCRLQIC